MTTVMEDDEYKEKLKEALANIADTLEKALAKFKDTPQEGQARVAMARYVTGYLGVSYGLKYGR